MSPVRISRTVASSCKAMEDDRAAGTGPDLGPPLLRTRYERELEPQLDIDEANQDWWADVYFDHTWDQQHDNHNDSFCRFCDGIENVREIRPAMEEALMRYVKARLWKRHDR